MLLLEAAAACALAVALAGPARGAPTRVASANCPWNVRGPLYSVAGHSTHLYGFEVEGVSCAFARAWVSKLVTQSGTGALRGPAGWTCLASSGRYSRVAAGGGCGPGRFSSLASLATASKFFAWHPVVQR